MNAASTIKRQFDRLVDRRGTTVSISDVILQDGTSTFKALIEDPSRNPGVNPNYGDPDNIISKSTNFRCKSELAAYVVPDTELSVQGVLWIVSTPTHPEFYEDIMVWFTVSAYRPEG